MLVPEGETKEFLGEEFLTWLWYYGESKNWTMDLPECQISYWMDELLVLKPDELGECSQKLAGTGPIKTSEAQAGLKKGKKVAETKLVLVHEGTEWTFTLAAQVFHFSSLKLSKPESTDPGERFLEMADELERISGLFDRMYHHFLEIRLSSRWKEKELPAMQDWIHRRQEAL